MKNLSAETWSLALCIAILPPIWAVLAPYLSVDVGAVALICAGLYVTNGNKLMDAPKITIGFLLGDLWGWLAVNAMQNSSWNADVTTFMTLFLLGGAAVIIAAMRSEIIHCTSWLCGWAITLTVLSPLEQGLQGSYAIQIAVAMAVGVSLSGRRDAVFPFLDRLRRGGRGDSLHSARGCESSSGSIQGLICP